MIKYIYNGPTQSISLATGKMKNAAGIEVSTFTDVYLIDGHEVSLPKGNAVVDNMIEAGFLTKIDTAKPKKKTGDETNG